MTGIYFQPPEPDLSHFHYQNNFSILVSNITEPISGKNPGYSLLSWALFVSLLIHALLLGVTIQPKKNLTASVPLQTIHIELQPVRPTPDALPSSSIEASLPELSVPVVPQAAAPNAITTTIKSASRVEQIKNEEQKTSVENASASDIYIPITPDELRALEDKPLYSLEPSDTDLKEVGTEPFGGVFDPRLRRKLQEQYSEKQAKAVGMSTYELANGSKVIKLSDNHCLSTLPQGKSENETNWYHIGCHEKTEGERMMDRVNETMRQRFQ